MHEHDKQWWIQSCLGGAIGFAVLLAGYSFFGKKPPRVLPVKRLTSPLERPAPVLSGQAPGISLLVPCFVVRIDPKVTIAIDREAATTQLLAAVQKRMGDPAQGVKLLGAAKADPANAAVVVSVLRGAKPEQVEGLRKALEPQEGYPVPVVVESAPEEKK